MNKTLKIVLVSLIALASLIFALTLFSVIDQLAGEVLWHAKVFMRNFQQASRIGTNFNQGAGSLVAVLIMACLAGWIVRMLLKAFKKSVKK